MKNVLSAIVGGIGLLLATAVTSSFITSPPSRAEFDVLRSKQVGIKEDISEIKDDIKDIKKILEQRR